MRPIDRRRALSLCASSLLVSCAGFTGDGRRPVVGLLLPLTGEHQALGTDMERAAERQNSKPSYLLKAFDTGGLPESAGAAATKAASAGASLLLGPVFTREVPWALAAAAKIPLITFSDDGDLVGSGAFVFGITPAQAIGVILEYARAQGVKRIAVVALDQAWGRQCAAAARLMAPRSGVSISQILLLENADNPSLAMQQLRHGAASDAVLLPDGGATLAALAPALAEVGLQLLGTNQWSGAELMAIPALQGAWFSAPDPAGVSSSEISAQSGLLPILAADASNIAATLASAGDMSRNSLLREEGFRTSLGHVRFTADGAVERSLSILSVTSNGIRVVAKSE